MRAGSQVAGAGSLLVDIGGTVAGSHPLLWRGAGSSAARTVCASLRTVESCLGILMDVVITMRGMLFNGSSKIIDK